MALPFTTPDPKPSPMPWTRQDESRLKHLTEARDKLARDLHALEAEKKYRQEPDITRLAAALAPIIHPSGADALARLLAGRAQAMIDLLKPFADAVPND